MSELALQLIEKEKKEKTGKLDLGNCGLTEIPEEVFELTWLEELVVSYEHGYIEENPISSNNNGEPNSISVIPENIERLRGLKKIILSRNNIVDISPLSNLIGLKYLSLEYNRIADISPLSTLIRLKSLKLSGNSIVDISPLLTLIGLQTLTLTSNKIIDISALTSLKGLESLEISNNHINDLLSLSTLTRLRTLELSTNQIVEISALISLKGLETLMISQNQIEDISPLLALTELQNLEIWSNKIEDISPLSTLIGLETLLIFDNQIEDISYISKIRGLKTLDLRYNEIKDLSSLQTLSNLRELILSHNNISNIEPLSSLVKLEFLYLSKNEISDIYPLSNLNALLDLDLSSNKIFDISNLGGLNGLESLSLRDNKITNIASLRSLTNLNFLDLSINEITSIGDLSYLKSLTKLFLNSNNISEISPLKNLIEISSLDLRDNKIVDITSLAELLKIGVEICIDWKYTGIIVGDNPLTIPPVEIVDRGREAVLDWFEQMEIGSAPLYESKLMILGQGEAGKTTFANLLVDSSYRVKKDKEISTLGVLIHRGKEFNHAEIKEQTIKAHLWDFGGQDIQKMLHQFFITDNCLYVLVSDKRAENTNFDYWFQIVNLLGPKSSVIVLENPKNIESANEDFPKNKYRELYKDLKIESYEVNLKHTRGKDSTKWNLLNESIASNLSQLEIVNRQIPLSWCLIREELSNIRKKYISKDEYYAICSKPEIGLSHKQGDYCLSYLHQLGDLVYFGDRELCANIFLDHNWLTKGLYYILSDKEIQDNNARFTRKQAYRQWDLHDYNESEKGMLINLLLKDKFDICYELPDEKDVFITPLLLPYDKPEEWAYETNLFFRYQYGFIPHGMFSRLIVRLHEKIDSRQRWKTGVRLVDKDTNTHAEVQQNVDPLINQNVIDIRINGDKNGCKQLLDFVRTEIERLHKDFMNINFQEKVACNCNTCLALLSQDKKPTFYAYRTLIEKIKNRKYTVDCENNNYNDVNIGNILSDIVIENAGKENRDSELLHYLKQMGMSITNITNTNNVTQSNFGKATASATASAEATNTVSIEIQNILGETEMLKEDIDRELRIKKIPQEEIDYAKSDIEVYENALRDVEHAKNNNIEVKPATKSRIASFIDDLNNEESTIGKTLKMLRKGKEYGVKLAKGYNTVAKNVGLPVVPEFALELVDKL